MTAKEAKVFGAWHERLRDSVFGVRQTCAALDKGRQGVLASLKPLRLPTIPKDGKLVGWGGQPPPGRNHAAPLRVWGPERESRTVVYFASPYPKRHRPAALRRRCRAIIMPPSEAHTFHLPPSPDLSNHFHLRLRFIRSKALLIMRLNSN